MPRKVHYCINHDNVVASGKCYECGNHICYNCQIDFLGHLFCGFRCLAIFLSKESVNALFILITGLFKLISWPFRSAARVQARGWFELTLVIGLMVSFYFIWSLGRQVRQLKFYERQSVRGGFVADSSSVVPPKIFEPSEGGMVYSNTLDIHGEAEENRIVSLSVNGQLRRVYLPEGGRFVFEDVKLKRGENRLEIRSISESGRASTLESISINYMSPTFTYLVKDFTRGTQIEKQVAFTFDGGSIDSATDEILDILKSKNVKSTFFLTGTFIRNYPETVKRIASEGHEVGNHTWSHPHLTTFEQNRRHNTSEDISDLILKEEFERTASLFEMITGQPMARLWRAPFGEYNEEILGWAARAGYKHIGWTLGQGPEENMDTMDWVADKNSSAYRSAEEISEKILTFAKQKPHGANGAIILMHLGTHRDDDFPHRKLPEIIDGLHSQGYRLVKISDMLSDGRG